MTFSLFSIIFYFVLLVVIARFFSRRIHNLKDFFLAGRSLGALPVALTFVASWFGAASTMGSINAFHDHGLSGAWQIVIPSILSFFIITFFIARPVARQKHLSQPEAVESHYGKTGRLLLALIILASVTTLIGSQMVVAGKFFQMVFGLDIQLATFLSTAAVVSYAMWGGYFTVVVTDITQVFFVAIGFLILLIFTATQAIPTASAWEHFLSAQPAHFWDMTHQWRENVFLVFTFVLAWCIAPEMWQRMSSTRNPKLAFRAGWLATLMMLFLFGLIVAIGLLSTQIVGKNDAVLVALALKIPNQALSAMVLIGFLSAVTSTLDSSMNIGSLTLTRDIYQGFLRPKAGDRELIHVGRFATALITLPAMAIALYYQDLIQILWISADIYASCMFFPVVGMLYLKKPGHWSGILGMSFGGLTVFVSLLIQNHIIPNLIHWPGWPYSTLLGVALSGTGYGLGYWLFSMKQPLSQTNKPGSEPQDALLIKQ